MLPRSATLTGVTATHNIDIVALLEGAGIKVVASTRARVRDRFAPSTIKVATVPNPDLATALSELTTGEEIPVVLVAHDQRVFVLSAGGSGIVAVQQIEGRPSEGAPALADRVSALLAEAFGVQGEAAPKKTKAARRRLSAIPDLDDDPFQTAIDEQPEIAPEPSVEPVVPETDLEAVMVEVAEIISEQK